MLSKDKRKTLVLLDAHAILHRAFHALPAFTSSKGEPTGALYGFSAFLLKVIRELKPNYIAACYDLPEPTFRHAAYENYKAKRPKMDDSLAVQINRSRDILEAFRVPIYDAPGFEADDILGTIVEKIHPVKSRKAGAAKPPFHRVKIIIASGDLDTLQLVKNDDVVVYTLKKGIQDTIIYDEKKVIERFGFGPELVPDFKALKGDPSDNIIGIKGIGEKSATELIKKYGAIENIFETLKRGGVDAKPRIIELLKNGEEEAQFSKTLAEIRKDAPIKFSLEDSAREKNFDADNVKKIFNDLGFKSLISRLPDENNKDQEVKADESSQPAALPSQPGRLNNTEVPEKLYEEVEKPLLKILLEMEKAGILLDIGCLKQMSQESHKELDALEKAIWKMAGEEFNVNSPKQMGVILFEKMGLGGAKIKRTASGSYSTNISELVKIKGKNKIIDEIIEYRELAKLVSTYIDALPGLVDENNRLHTDFDSFGTVTGRISSQNPNLQNIPQRHDKDKNVRRAFVADKGFKLIAFDYSQIELRVAAILSGDKKLKEIFAKGEDVHASVASEVFNVSHGDVTPEMRRVAKVINFGIMYGMGVNALRQNIGCAREEAKKFYEEYFKKFNGVADYIEKIKKSAAEKGYTETLFGRKRFFPEINSPIDYIRKEAERMAVNAPIQGTAADFIKIAMVRTDEALAKGGLKENARLLLQIHDELLYETREDVIDKTVPIIIGAMEGVYKSDVPIKVNIEIGDNWGEMKKFLTKG